MPPKIKALYNLLPILILFFKLTPSISQEVTSLSMYQDARLMLLGDDHGNEAGTLNLLVRLKFSGKQKRLGYFVLMPEFEKANLETPFERYSVNLGYTFNRVEIPFVNLYLYKFEFTPSLGYGYINRHHKSTFNWACALEVAYKLNNWLKVNFVNQLTERTDLKMRYDKKVLRFSYFFGFEISLFKLSSNSSSSWHVF